MVSVPDCPWKKGREKWGNRDPLERACLLRQIGEGVEMPAEMAVSRVKQEQGGADESEPSSHFLNLWSWL